MGSRKTFPGLSPEADLDLFYPRDRRLLHEATAELCLAMLRGYEALSVPGGDHQLWTRAMTRAKELGW